MNNSRCDFYWLIRFRDGWGILNTYIPNGGR